MTKIYECMLYVVIIFIICILKHHVYAKYYFFFLLFIILKYKIILDFEQNEEYLNKIFTFFKYKIIFLVAELIPY